MTITKVKENKNLNLSIRYDPIKEKYIVWEKVGLKDYKELFTITAQDLTGWINTHIKRKKKAKIKSILDLVKG